MVETTLLHGTLHVTIREVDSGNLSRKLTSNIQKIVGFLKGNPKTYVRIDLDEYRVGQTRLLRKKKENPRWNVSFQVHCAHRASNVKITIKDVNRTTIIGTVDIDAAALLEGDVDRLVKIGSEIHVKLQYLDVTKDPNWGGGIKSSTYPGVPNTFFPERQGCRVSLYQDAHVTNNFIVELKPSNGRYYEPRKCWEDVFDAITNAKHFIYITGWSVKTGIFLKRKSGREREEYGDTLGELLRKKAIKVKVLMLIWDDWTSVDVSDKINYGGYMETHGHDTKRYFKGSKVKCVLCRRNPDDSAGFINRNIDSRIYTHHQKSLVVDAEWPNDDSERRCVVSFVGGLDLCHGRYDTPDHSLFKTLDGAHFEDFLQPNFDGSRIARGGPRQPWHDIHSRLEGEIAWDVLTNFVERWKKQGKGEGTLFSIPQSWVNDKDKDVTPPNDKGKESWNVQLFRSIDSGATSEFPKTPQEAVNKGLVRGKHSIIDMSIQDAYIHAIRRAKNFIYIENQYFIGSSFDWKFRNIQCKNVDALHLIPKELSLKIVKKIEAGEKFTIYVVLPMWPEGEPESATTQAILYGQRKTMEMMYKDIIRALRKKKSLKRSFERKSLKRSYKRKRLTPCSRVLVKERKEREGKNGEKRKEGNGKE